MPSKNQHKIRREFLVAFTKALIANSMPLELKKEIMSSSKKISEVSLPPEKPKVEKIPKAAPMRLPRFAHRMKIKQPSMQPPAIQIPPQTNQTVPGRINLGKVARFLKDPSVLSVECTGPEKHLLINRSGAIQTTPATLTKEEIDAILNEVSLQTQIPIVPGLFKALFRNLLITAVVSDYVGSRFIIQKRTPF